MIRVVAKQRVRQGKKEKVINIFSELIEETRKENGCILYTLNESVNDPDTLAVIEAWETQEALDAHMVSEHFKRLVPQIGGYLAEKIQIEIYKELI